VAEREGFTSTALILPTTLANFCRYYQRYQSLATVAHPHSTSIDRKTNSHLLVAMVVRFGLIYGLLGRAPKIILGTRELEWCREGELNPHEVAFDEF